MVIIGCCIHISINSREAGPDDWHKLSNMKSGPLLTWKRMRDECSEMN